MLRQELRGRGNFFAQDLPHNRPVLLLLDRQGDMSVMLMHGWSYQALVHETLPTRLNHVTTTNAKGQQQQQDLDCGDPLWMQNKWKDFPHATEALDVATKQYKADEEAFKMKTAMAGSGGEDGMQLVGEAATQGLSDAINLIPEMQEKKRRIDIHTGLLTGILAAIKSRNLHKLHEIQSAMMRSAAFDIADLEQILEAAEYEKMLEGCDNAGAFEYLKKLQKLMTMGPTGGPQDNSNQLTAGVNQATSWLSGAMSSALTQASNIMGSQWKCNASRLVEGVMEQYGSPEVEQLIYKDARTQSGGAQVTGQFKEAIVSVVGGGNYMEYQNIQSVAATPESDRKVIYGSTDLCSPAAFMEQLTRLK